MDNFLDLKNKFLASITAFSVIMSPQMVLGAEGTEEEEETSYYHQQNKNIVFNKDG